MPKSSKKQIVDDEKKVIAELQKDSNESIDKIAKKCGFSRQKVWRIVKRLEKERTIWGYTAIVDDAKLSVKKFLVLIKRINIPVTEENLNKVVNRELKKEAERIGAVIKSSFYVHGCYDYFICITAPSIKQVKKFCEILNKLFKDYISEMEILEVIFPVQNCGIQNPNLEELKELF
jgi:DNA-binding Lrp family transcriptional regulator